MSASNIRSMALFIVYDILYIGRYYLLYIREDPSLNIK